MLQGDGKQDTSEGRMTLARVRTSNLIKECTFCYALDRHGCQSGGKSDTTMAPLCIDSDIQCWESVDNRAAISRPSAALLKAGYKSGDELLKVSHVTLPMIVNVILG